MRPPRALPTAHFDRNERHAISGTGCDAGLRAFGPDVFHRGDVPDWPRSQNEDVDQSLGALLPIRTGCYVSDASSLWAAGHVADVARLYRRALENHEAGAKYHAVAEEGVSLRAIAEAIGRGLRVPVVSLSAEEASAHFGWLNIVVNFDLQASSAKTRKTLGWNPAGPGLITDLEHMDYSLV